MMSSMRNLRALEIWKSTLIVGWLKKRIYPSINVNRSGTRREELLIESEILQKIWVLRKLLYPMDELEATEFLLDKNERNQK